MERQTRTIAISALGIALVFLATRLIQFPIPLGYAHAGNCVILLFAALFGPKVGALSAGLGSALADLLSFPVWTVPTLIIKTIMGAIAGRFCYAPRGAGKKRIIGGAVLAILEMIVGYFIAGSILYGSIAAGATQLVGLSIEGAAAIVLFLPLYYMLVKVRH